MPADFDTCVRAGGRTRTINVNPTHYMHVCYDKNGKSHAGEVREHAKKDFDPAAAQLLQMKEQEKQTQRNALDSEVKLSQDNQQHRIDAARKDPTMNL